MEFKKGVWYPGSLLESEPTLEFIMRDLKSGLVPSEIEDLVFDFILKNKSNTLDPLKKEEYWGYDTKSKDFFDLRKEKLSEKFKDYNIEEFSAYFNHIFSRSLRGNPLDKSDLPVVRNGINIEQEEKILNHGFWGNADTGFHYDEDVRKNNPKY